eukprot:6309470-Amphidinium_carterae.1
MAAGTGKPARETCVGTVMSSTTAAAISCKGGIGLRTNTHKACWSPLERKKPQVEPGQSLKAKLLIAL